MNLLIFYFNIYDVGKKQFSGSENTQKLKKYTLREKKLHFKAFFEHQPVYCYIISKAGDILDINKAALKTLGYKKQELIGKPLASIYAPESIPKMKKLFQKWKKTGHLKDEEMVILTKKGSKRLVLLSTEVIKDRAGQIQHSISIQKDITEQKEIENSLRESEERYKALFNRTLFCVYIHDFQGWFIDANQAALDLLGYTKEEISSINFTSLIDRVQVKIALKNINEIKRSGHRKKPTVYKLQKKDGNFVWVETEASLIYKNNKPYAIQGIARDISENRRMEVELKQERDFALQVMNNIGQGITVVDQKGRFEYVNPAYAQMIGLEPEELIGETPYDFTVNEDHKQLHHASNKRKKGLANTYETRLKRLDGSEVNVIITGVPRYKDGQVTGSFAVITDLTEKINVEKELQRTQRLESLGALAGGIAHDFNNLLTGIMGHISLAKLKIDNKDSLKQSLDKMEKVVEETKNLTQQLLTFAKGG
ncbi:MAG: PAS domain S-box protein, partial [Candidatus Aminicenantes bacterium]|nr:PAS domain S-box protein [Candidatus Aminicenantes bacterium]